MIPFGWHRTTTVINNNIMPNQPMPHHHCGGYNTGWNRMANMMATFSFANMFMTSLFPQKTQQNSSIYPGLELSGGAQDLTGCKELYPSCKFTMIDGKYYCRTADNDIFSSDSKQDLIKQLELADVNPTKKAKTSTLDDSIEVTEGDEDPVVSEDDVFEFPPLGKGYEWQKAKESRFATGDKYKKDMTLDEIIAQMRKDGCTVTDDEEHVSSMKERLEKANPDAIKDGKVVDVDNLYIPVKIKKANNTPAKDKKTPSNNTSKLPKNAVKLNNGYAYVKTGSSAKFYKPDGTTANSAEFKKACPVAWAQLTGNVWNEDNMYKKLCEIGNKKWEKQPFSKMKSDFSITKTNEEAKIHVQYINNGPFKSSGCTLTFKLPDSRIKEQNGKLVFYMDIQDIYNKLIEDYKK